MDIKDVSWDSTMRDLTLVLQGGDKIVLKDATMDSFTMSGQDNRMAGPKGKIDPLYSTRREVRLTFAVTVKHV